MALPEESAETAPGALEEPETRAQDEDPDLVYWAASASDDIAGEMVEKIRAYYERITRSGLCDLWRRTHAAFYGLDEDTGSHETSTIIEFGDDGEKLGGRSNQLRSLVRYIWTSATSDRPTVSPKAINSTAEALAQVPTAKRVIEYYFKNKRMERYLRSVALRSLLYGKAYLWQIWDRDLSDVVFKACSPYEVACDLERDSGDHDWFIIRRLRNKYDLAATMPALKEELIGLDKDCLEDEIAGYLAFGLHSPNTDEGDTTYEYHLLHRKTPALPLGRYVILAGKDRILFDGPLPFPDMGVHEMIPEEFLETGSVGYASAWDLLGLQTAYDALLSTCITNLDAFGENDILLPEGSELGLEEVRSGLNVIRHTPGEQNKPTVLEKFSIRPEAFQLRDWLKSDMETLPGVNSVARGEPESSLKSGAALALVQAQAVHFQSGYVAAYVELVEHAATNTLRLIKAFADEEYVAAIAGSNDPDGLAAFSAPQVDQIDRVDCELGAPIFRTLAGKFDMANNLLERGLLQNAGEYFQVLDTGRLEPVTDPLRQEALFAESIKARLMEAPAVTQVGMDPMTGQPIMQVEGLRAVITDNPVACIRAAKHVLDSIENRKNPAIIVAASTYILEVLRTWRNAPPDLLMLLQYPIPPSAQAEMTAMNAALGGGAETEGPPGKTQDKGKAPPTGKGTQEGQEAPDQGSGMPSLPRPAEPPRVS